MPRRAPKPLPTIWRVSDDLWRVVERVLAELDPPKRSGRKRIDPRGALDAIIFRLLKLACALLWYPRWHRPAPG